MGFFDVLGDILSGLMGAVQKADARNVKNIQQYARKMSDDDLIDAAVNTSSDRVSDILFDELDRRNK